ncbi:Beta-lactamase hydrolase-like protein [Tsuneonella dongtanensis]|uniref:Beta-lactamase hydrolase-like protein n=1 Tax=Tsuneonella dongtanensis TaxID=692370 RepID=A0A1B2A9L0_9SPHN|nr:TIGR01244 family sulfur transferase [Tsuneonella dongtanensis]ANY18822.1 Beta-lactamase hydrolase-like protein [Tsuneonella dongtanensis]
MNEFRKLSDTMFASPQIDLDDVAQAKEQGVALIVNNRPEGESPDQVPGAEIEAAARAAGIDYLAIPITHAGFSHPQVTALAEALESAGGPVLGYCRSGTRSTLLWALARASQGESPDAIAAAAAAAGYDVGPVRPAMDALVAQSRQS